MKSARHNLILEIIDTMDIETQEELRHVKWLLVQMEEGKGGANF